MAHKPESPVVIGTFDDAGQAQRFVEALKQAGFSENEIGVATPHDSSRLATLEGEALAGAISGGAWGALFGAALAIGMIPGIGPVLGAGLLAGIFGGAAVGAAAGGIIAPLIGLGLSESEARHYASRVHAGHTIVVVRSATRLAEATAILRRIEQSEGHSSDK